MKSAGLAGLLAGPATYSNLFTMQSFQDDYVDTFTLTSAQLWALGAVGDNSHPIPNDTSETFTSTANSFMVGGGDGLTVLESASNIVQTADSELELLLAYVGGLPDPFTYAADGRIAKG